MPDISMCSNNKCPKSEICYRFKAKPYKYQTFSAFEYDNTGCSSYMELWKKSGTKETKVQKVPKNK